ncbi:hypothetical protein JCM6882_005932 [Rhodosporidiobolus microsporus]
MPPDPAPSSPSPSSSAALPSPATSTLNPSNAPAYSAGAAQQMLTDTPTPSAGANGAAPPQESEARAAEARSSAPSPSVGPAAAQPPGEAGRVGEVGATPPRSPAGRARGAGSPSTPTRGAGAAAAGGSPSSASPSGVSPRQQHHSLIADEQPPRGASSSPAGAAGAPSSSPSSSTAAGNRSPSSSSPSHSASSSPSSSSSAPPSRRVKVYKLKDDAWIDLGTGTCAGVFLQAGPSDAELLEDGLEEGEEGQERSRRARPLVREEDEGAWIVVRRERGPGEGGRRKRRRKAQGRAEGSPTKGKGGEGEGEGRMLVEGEGEGKGADEGELEEGAGDEEYDEEYDEEGEDDDDSSIILRTRVQPYPPGFSLDDLLSSSSSSSGGGAGGGEGNDDEITSIDEAGNATLDAGGYQRQQDTLIVWTERAGAEGLAGLAGMGVEGGEDDEEEVEMALSFATSSGCSEIWEFIKAARRYAAEQQALHSPSPSPSLSSSDRAFPPYHPTSSFSSLSTLPEPSLGNLATLEAAIRAVSRTTVGRERAANIIARSGFVEKLVKVHEEAEDLESLEDLHALCRVMQTILLLNDSALFDLVIKDELILGVVGMLEYDPDFPTMRASYRHHLSSPSSFVPVVPPSLLPPSLLSKIHATHRLHYLKDVVLARILEDSTFSMLNSHIYFNEVDIVNEVAGERELVRAVFGVLEEGEEASGAAGASRGRAAQTGSGGGKGKERETRDLGLGPKRTIGPELPDDLVAARKRARVDSPPRGGAGPSSPSSSSSAAALVPDSAPPSSSASTSQPLPPTQPSPSAPVPAPTAAAYLPKLHATLFLQQLAQMAKNLQLPIRTGFFKTLCDRGLLSALEGALRFSERLAQDAPPLPPSAQGAQGGRRESEDEKQKRQEDAKAMRAAALGLWMNVVDLAAPDVRAYCLRQGRDVEVAAEAEEEAEGEGEGAGEAADGEGKTEKGPAQPAKTKEQEAHEARATMLGLLIEMFKQEEDLGMKTQLCEALRVLVDVAGEGGPLEAPPRMRQEDPEAEKFIQYFYDHCLLGLVQPLIDLPERKETDPPLDLTPSSTALLSHICDLLSFFISHHTFRSKYVVLANPALAKSIGRLLRPRPRLTRHKHLRLAALRVNRAIVARTDEFYNRFLIKHDLIRPVLETADEEKSRDNLLGSACLEFFEYLRTTNAKALLNHTMDRAGDTVRRLARGNGLDPPLRTFESLIARWEMNNEPPPLPTVTVSAAPGAESLSASSGGAGGATSASMQRQRSFPAGWSNRMEVEEESYFNGSDDEDDDGAVGGDSAAPEAAAEPLAGPAAAALASASFGSSRRKREREQTHNPSSASSAAGPSLFGAAGSGAGDAKRPKLDDDAVKSEGGETGLPRSQTWPGGAKGKGASLVGYLGDGDSDDDDEKAEEEKLKTEKVEDEDASTAGGFIRERSGALDAAASAVEKASASAAGSGSAAMDVDDEEHKPATTNGQPASPSSASPAADAPPPPLLSLGELKRKKEEDDDGELGLLAKKKAPSPSSAPKSASPPTAPSTAAAPKPGGFKIAFGGLKSKFGGGGGGQKAGGKEA